MSSRREAECPRSIACPRIPHSRHRRSRLGVPTLTKVALGLPLVPDDRGLTLKPGCTHAYRDLSNGRLDMNAITTKDGVEIFYKDWGKGQPIVFSHGWPLSAD